ncbi:MAG: endonuclease/exonuclease/phosphatase family protein [Pirellulaceae bacterium]
MTDEQSVERERRITSVLKSTVIGRRHVNRIVTWSDVIRLRFSKRVLVRSTIVLLAVFLVPFVASRIMSPWRRVSIHSSSQQDARADGRLPTTVRVACFNIAHGRGTAISNWDGGDYQDRISRLDQIAALLREVDADIVVLNEVDFDASWSYHTNQARFLANKSGYSHWVEQRNLDFRFMFWTWRFGNAVLSRYEITDAQLVDLPSFSALETLLAGKKRSVLCDINVDGLPIRIVAAHLSHRSESLRVLSADIITSIVRESTTPTILAGDMNSTPVDFPGATTDENGNNAIETFDESGYFLREPSRLGVGKDDFTYHSNDPRSVIDWILVPAKWDYAEHNVSRTVLSDHRLVYADVVPTDLQ